MIDDNMFLSFSSGFYYANIIDNNYIKLIHLLHSYYSCCTTMIDIISYETEWFSFPYQFNIVILFYHCALVRRAYV